MAFGGSHKESTAQRCTDMLHRKEREEAKTEIPFQIFLAKHFFLCVYLPLKANAYILSM